MHVAAEVLLFDVDCKCQVNCGFTLRTQVSNLVQRVIDARLKLYICRAVQHDRQMKFLFLVCQQLVHLFLEGANTSLSLCLPESASATTYGVEFTDADQPIHE